MSSFVALPMELQSCCVASLDLTSAGRFGQASQASRQLVNERLVEEKAACARAVYEKISSRWCETLAATWRVADGPDLIALSDGGAKFYKCTCKPDKEFAVGRSYINLARHLGSRQHWIHWREAHGAQPTEAAWLAFGASLPGRWAPLFVHQRRI